MFEKWRCGVDSKPSAWKIQGAKFKEQVAATCTRWQTVYLGIEGSIFPFESCSILSGSIILNILVCGLKFTLLALLKTLWAALATHALLFDLPFELMQMSQRSCSVMWNLPLKNAVQNHILAGPPEHSDMMAFNNVALHLYINKVTCLTWCICAALFFHKRMNKCL